MKMFQEIKKRLFGRIQYRRKTRNFGILNKIKPDYFTTKFFLKKGKLGTNLVELSSYL